MDRRDVCVGVFLLIICIFLAEASFNCKRTGMSCNNQGTCLENGTCQCPADFQGYDCSVNTSNNCTDLACEENGGLCHNNGTADLCFCNETRYGDKCQFKTVNVTCFGDRMEINIYPFGNFTGKIFLLNQTRENCSLQEITPSTAGNYQQPEWRGYGIVVNHTDDNCGNASASPQGQTTTFFRDVVIEYNSNYVTNLDQVVAINCIIQNIENGVVKFASTKTVNLDEADVYVRTQVENTYQPLTFEVSDPVTNAVKNDSAVMAVGDVINLDFELKDTSIYKTVAVLNCTVYDSSDKKNIDVPLVENGCPVDSGKSVYKNMTRANDTKVSIEISVFKFSGSDVLVVECFLKLCEASDNACDAKTCQNGVQSFGRRKRAADASHPSEMKMVRTLKVQDLTSGETQSCGGGCENGGLCGRISGVDKCFCPEGFSGSHCTTQSDNQDCFTTQSVLLAISLLATTAFVFILMTCFLMLCYWRSRHKVVELSPPFSEVDAKTFAIPRVQCAHL